MSDVCRWREEPVKGVLALLRCVISIVAYEIVCVQLDVGGCVGMLFGFVERSVRRELV